MRKVSCAALPPFPVCRIGECERDHIPPHRLGPTVAGRRCARPRGARRYDPVVATGSTSDVARRWAEGWRPRVWLFDFDGTLADSVELIMASFRHATAQVLGYVPEEAVLRAGIGLP